MKSYFIYETLLAAVLTNLCVAAAPTRRLCSGLDIGR